jgi:hypothetical protein
VVRYRRATFVSASTPKLNFDGNSLPLILTSSSRAGNHRAPDEPGRNNVEPANNFPSHSNLALIGQIISVIITDNLLVSGG